MGEVVPWHNPAWILAIGTLLTTLAGMVVALIRSVRNHETTRKTMGKDIEKAVTAIETVGKEITNDHDINLRDDMDGKHLDLLRAIEKMVKHVEAVDCRIARNDTEQRERDAKLDSRITVLETKVDAHGIRLNDSNSSLQAVIHRVDANQQAHREAQATCRDNCISRIELLETSHPTQ